MPHPLHMFYGNLVQLGKKSNSVIRSRSVMVVRIFTLSLFTLSFTLSVVRIFTLSLLASTFFLCYSGITFQFLSTILCLAWDHWWWFNNRNAHVVDIVNSIRLKWCNEVKWRLFLYCIRTAKLRLTLEKNHQRNFFLGLNHKGYWQQHLY